MNRNQKLSDLIKEGIRKVHDAIINEFSTDKFNIFVYIYRWIRFLWFSFWHFSGPDDYFVNQLYKKSRSEIRKFITLGKMYKLRKIYNSNADYNKFNDKTAFNTMFSQYIKRLWLDADSCTVEELKTFAEKTKSFICKPKALGGGKGVHKYSVKEDEDYKLLLKEKKGFILEELIVQHDELAKMNPYAVNTFRITTIKEEQDVYIISAMFRCGTKDIPVDNWYQGGITAAVDIETGIIFTKGVAKVPERVTYLKHPVSNITFVGFQVPFWTETVELVKNIAAEVDDIRLVGWDVAITNTGPCIVEGNHRSNTTILSVADGIGKYEIIKNIRKKYGRKMR